jgi:hypothetical protein
VALLFLAAFLVVALPGRALAYIDPSAGSIVLQLVLGGVAGILVAVRLYFRRVTSFFGGRRTRSEPAREEAADQQR